VRLGAFDEPKARGSSAHHVERVAKTMVGVNDHRQFAGAANAAHLLGELGQREQHQVGHA